MVRIRRPIKILLALRGRLNLNSGLWALDFYTSNNHLKMSRVNSMR
jgi:hypothetical protein